LQKIEEQILDQAKKLGDVWLGVGVHAPIEGQKEGRGAMVTRGALQILIENSFFFFLKKKKIVFTRGACPRSPLCKSAPDQLVQNLL
jgi:hypothetical protein